MSVVRICLLECPTRGDLVGVCFVDGGMALKECHRCPEAAEGKRVVQVYPLNADPRAGAVAGTS